MKAFESEEMQETKKQQDKIEALEAEFKRKDRALTELIEEHTWL